MRHSSALAGAGWRIDRRTFLKAMGLGSVGLVAGGLLGSRLAPFITPVAAQSSAIDDLALQLQFDPDRIFRFVADQIRYQPYAGVLRGPNGTLMARAGNSADQAALLAALLRASGVEARYVLGSIDDMSAASILGTSVSNHSTAHRELTEALTGAGEGGRPAVFGEPDETVRAQLDAAVAAADAAIAWTRAKLDDTVSTIGTTLASAGITLPFTGSALPAVERTGHAWVRMAAGPSWVDLDPSLPGAVPGDFVATPEGESDELPDDLRHRVTFAVIGETVTAGALKEESLLEVDLFADAVGGQPIGFMNLEHEGLKALGTELIAGLEGGTTYLPALLVGADLVVGPGALRFGGDAPDPFGELGSGSPGPREGEPTAEWAQVTISSPGAEPVVVRRPMFDRLGPAARAVRAPDLSLLAPAQLVAVEPGAPADYLPAQRTHWLTVHPGTFGGDALARAASATDTDAALAGVVHTYHVMREAAGAEVGLGSGIRAFADAPNIVALTVDQERAEDGALGLRTVLDIWHRSYGTTLIADGQLDAPPQLVSGVLSHVAERLLAGEAVNDAADAGLVSVGAVFDRAVAEGVPVRLVRDAQEVGGLPFVPDSLERLRAAISGGRVAVVPERQVRIGADERVGWWVVDPATGAVFDQMDDGRGVAGESATLFANTVRMARPMRDLGLCVGLAVMVTSLLLVSQFGIAGGVMVGGGEGVLAVALGAAGSGVAGYGGGALAGGRIIACA
jgi:transglutaminase-like putative cysteine protease